MFQTLAEKVYTPFHAKLQCGNFMCPVQLHPRPEPYDRFVTVNRFELQLLVNWQVKQDQCLRLFTPLNILKGHH